MSYSYLLDDSVIGGSDGRCVQSKEAYFACLSSTNRLGIPGSKASISSCDYSLIPTKQASSGCGFQYTKNVGPFIWSIKRLMVTKKAIHR